VLLDVYGSLHDPGQWSEPEKFVMGRFLDARPDPFGYLPQGGGPPEGHRCPGERVAVELIKVATRVLLDVKPSDGYLIPLRRMPTRPFPAS
jgi:fatty-acid peroxygenase